MGFRSESRTRHVDFALKVALDMSLFIALSKAIPQGKRRLDRQAPSRQRMRRLDGTMR